MKKFIKHISLVAAGCALMIGTGQTYAQDLSLGLRGGGQWSQFSKFATDHGITGANVGITAVYSTNEHFGFGGDLLYSRQGGDYNVQTYSPIYGNGVTSYRVQNDYVRLVPKVMWFFRDVDDRFRPKVTGGVNLGFMTRSEDIVRGYDMTSAFNTFDVGAQLGLGFNYRIASRIWLQFDAEYMLGLMRANDINTNYPNNLANNTLSLNGGIAFGISH